MAKCVECGKHIEREDKYCSWCGAGQKGRGSKIKKMLPCRQLRKLIYRVESLCIRIRK